jgi:hypothetical protein
LGAAVIASYATDGGQWFDRYIRYYEAEGWFAGGEWDSLLTTTMTRAEAAVWIVRFIGP